MEVAALVSSIVALVGVVVSLIFTWRQHVRDVERRHNERRPVTRGEWARDTGIVLTLIGGPDDGLDEASDHLGNSQFDGAAEGERAPFDEGLGHPWPLAYSWELPPIVRGPAETLHLAVRCVRKGEKPWEIVVAVDKPNTRSAYEGVY